MLDGGQHGTYGPEGGVPAGGVEHRVGIEGTSAAERHLGEALEVLGGMDLENRLE